MERSAAQQSSRCFGPDNCAESVLLYKCSKHLGCTCTVLVHQHHDSSVEFLWPEAFRDEANGLVHDCAGIPNNQPKESDLVGGDLSEPGKLFPRESLLCAAPGQ